MSSMGCSWASYFQNLVTLGLMGKAVFCIAEKEAYDPLGFFHLQQLGSHWSPAVGCNSTALEAGPAHAAVWHFAADVLFPHRL